MENVQKQKLNKTIRKRKQKTGRNKTNIEIQKRKQELTHKTNCQRQANARQTHDKRAGGNRAKTKQKQNKAKHKEKPNK